MPGNHEYQTANAAGYYGYFGAAAGDPAKGSYAHDLGAWRVLKLTLHPTSYDFQLVPVAGRTYTDSGTGIPCH